MSTGILPLIFEGDQSAAGKKYAGDDFPAFADTIDAYKTCLLHATVIRDVSSLLEKLHGVLTRLQSDGLDAPAAIFVLTCHLFDDVLKSITSDSPCIAMLKRRMREYLLKPPTSYQSKQQGV